MRSLAAALALALALAGGCKKEADEQAAAGTDVPPPLPAAAATQMRAACDAWVAHVCRCAGSTPELAETCGLARAVPDALDLAIRAAQAGNNTALDQRGLLANANRIQKRCVEESARLETRCPRVAAAPAAPPR